MASRPKKEIERVLEMLNMKAKVIGNTVYTHVKKGDIVTIKDIVAGVIKFAAEVWTDDNRVDIVYFDDLQPVI